MTTGKVKSTPQDLITYKIIGCAIAVHRELGPGLREDSYQRAFAHKLADSGLAFEQQKLYEVYDDPVQKRLIGFYIPDYIVEETVIVEIKALSGLDNSHLAQVICYLVVSGCPVGLLFNSASAAWFSAAFFHPEMFPPIFSTANGFSFPIG